MLSVSMMKTKEGRRCSSEMTLTLAKNALQKVFGYSPNQLVLGYRLNLPSVIAPQLPALEICYCNLLQKNLKAFCKLFYPDERLQLFLLKAFGLGLIFSMRLGRMVGRTSICVKLTWLVLYIEVKACVYKASPLEGNNKGCKMNTHTHTHTLRHAHTHLGYLVQNQF